MSTTPAFLLSHLRRCSDLIRSLPPGYRNPNSFFQRRANESDEDFRQRLQGTTWGESKRRIGTVRPSARRAEYVFCHTILLDRITDPHRPSLGVGSKPASTKKCDSCISFDVRALHLNDRSHCTCLDLLEGPGKRCTPEGPCSTCVLLINRGRAMCNNCNDWSNDLNHAKRCFNCMQHILARSFDFHLGTARSAMMLGISASPAYFSAPWTGQSASAPYPTASFSFQSINHDESSNTADYIDSLVPPTLSPSNTVFDSITEDDMATKNPTPVASMHIISPSSLNESTNSDTSSNPPPLRRTSRARARAANKRKRESSPSSASNADAESDSNSATTASTVPRTIPRPTRLPAFQYAPPGNPSPTFAPHHETNYTARALLQRREILALNVRRLRQTEAAVRARRTYDERRRALRVIRLDLGRRLRAMEVALRDAEVQRLMSEIQRVQRE